MIRVRCDRKGRIQLHASLISKYGEEFLIVQAPGKLILFPIPRDPVKDLQELGKKLKGYTIDELKKMIQEQAEEEVSSLSLRSNGP